MIRLDRVSVTFGRGDDALKALDDVTIEMRDGEFVGLVGPSGCGKSTILKIVCGLLATSSGTITVAGKPVERGKLSVGIAFQNPTLLPWLTVERNVMLPLKIVEPFRSQYRAKRRGEFRDRVHRLLAQVGLEGFANRFPWQLSGGMQQRASLCRALIHGPKLLLLDEPFGALDHFTREALWGTMQELWMEGRPTVLLVTHDLREAAYLATRICVMSPRPGRIICDEAVSFARQAGVQLQGLHGRALRGDGRLGPDRDRRCARGGMRGAVPKCGLPHRRIVSLDTDGGIMFNLGILATLANEQPKNLFIVVWDNECYQSIGGPPTHTSGRVDIAAIGRGASIEHAYTVKTLNDFDRHCQEGLRAQAPYLVVAKVDRSVQRDIKRKHSDGREDKYIFVRHVEQTENIVIMGPSEHN